MLNKKWEIIFLCFWSVFFDIICKKKNLKWYDEIIIVFGYLKYCN